MKHLKALLLIALAVTLASVALAQPASIATVSASGPFTLRGATVNPEGVPSWPAMSGDEIAAQAVPVTITFPDGSRIVLSPNSRGRVQTGADGRPTFQLISGEALYDLRQLDAVRLLALERTVTPPAFRGTYSIGAARRGGTFWTARNTALVLAGAAGAGVATGIVATSTPDPVSPIR
ncbi:MAG: hypothetical protein M9913_09395 [Bryobacteraceae bacterium]|nr:hypothetical protein [Solibacteraceae bacterium]MCL4844470.1 hypothetical protein [Bryobacteraceae bacterium]MCO5351098.1 hypothetical protein [Bryobacteraceae bacterium]